MDPVFVPVTPRMSAMGMLTRAIRFTTHQSEQAMAGDGVGLCRLLLFPRRKCVPVRASQCKFGV
ncbi:uncharacterized protein METZ01_LOCUS205207 [marine metagenome]|uniref:Uncharacterized protein n=1 Tax=marine metagenome TaxID=408172 RepID=A0A382EQV6_9ZZZZ